MCCSVLQRIAACCSMPLHIQARASQPRCTLERVMTRTWLYNAQSSHFARLWPTAWPTAVSFSSGADASAPNPLPSTPTSTTSLSIPFPKVSAASPLSSWFECMGGWGRTCGCVEVCGRDTRAHGGGARCRCTVFGYLCIPRISILCFWTLQLCKVQKNTHKNVLSRSRALKVGSPQNCRQALAQTYRQHCTSVHLYKTPKSKTGTFRCIHYVQKGWTSQCDVRRATACCQ